MSLPPLVSPAAELTRDEVARYSRHLIIPEIGVLGQKRLKNARVLVIGAGGLGSPTLLYLAAAGVGTLGIVDFDTVDESNLQRQIIHGTSDIGRPKTHSARDSILGINPLITVRLHEFRLDVDNAVALFTDYDLIIDGSDNFATRYLVNDAAALAHKPYVWGSIYRFSGQVSVFWEDAPDGLGLNYRDLYPDPPPPGSGRPPPGRSLLPPPPPPSLQTTCWRARQSGPRTRPRCRADRPWPGTPPHGRPPCRRRSTRQMLA